MSRTPSTPDHASPPTPALGQLASGRPGVGIRPSWEPWAAAVLLLLAIGFGAHVVQRSAFSDRKRTDAGVFFRAGYAVRADLNPYAIPDDNQWYFLYPPGVAPIFAPLADPPKPTSPAAAIVSPPPHVRGTFVPYPISVAIWYLISAACAAISIELLARTLIRGSPDPSIRALTPASGGWWAVRLWPLFMVLPDVLSTLSRGQVNLVVLACICLGIHLLAQQRRAWAGAAFAAAAFIKVIPGIFLFDVLTRRGSRAIAGYIACGLAVMVALPVVVYGPSRAYEYTRIFTDRVILAGVQSSEDRLQAGSSFANTDNLSIQGALHNLTHISTPRGHRPDAPATWIRITHFAVSIAMLGATLLMGPRPWSRGAAAESAAQIMLRIGMLCCIMVLASPMTHRHYFVWTLPAIAVLTQLHLARSPLAVPHKWGATLIAGYIVLQSVPRAVQSGPLRDIAFPTMLTLIVWGLCAVQLARHNRTARKLVAAES